MVNDKLILIETHCYSCVGQHVEGIWHTAIVAYGREYFFGPSGIQTARPVSTRKEKSFTNEKIKEREAKQSRNGKYYQNIHDIYDMK